jgi:outer membrane protein OmpA-like peptidoglycan-associated protein
MKTHHITLCLLGSVAITNIGYADEINFGKTAPSASQVIDALNPTANDPDVTSPEDTGQHLGKTRSIDMSNLTAHPTKKAPKQQPQFPTNHSYTQTAMSMEILFDYNSSELTAVAKDYLKPVGEALSSDKLQNLGFIVEGHTDAIGGNDYNKNLSEKRAASVKQYLVDEFHIAPSRMQVVGKGKNDLLDPTNPGSDVNRRVRIVAVK